jgi:hypothetical protein
MFIYIYVYVYRAKWCERIQGPRLQRGDAGWTAANSSSEGEIIYMCISLCM